MTRDAWLHLRLTPAERAALRDRAEKERRKVSEVARELLSSGLADGAQAAAPPNGAREAAQCPTL